jgi:hypothetical protein
VTQRLRDRGRKEKGRLNPDKSGQMRTSVQNLEGVEIVSRPRRYQFGRFRYPVLWTMPMTWA